MFLVAFAVVDDLGAITLIALFYTAEVSGALLAAALAVWLALLALNRLFRISSLFPYLAGGVAMWFLFLQSGVHATLAGVLLAFAVPFVPKTGASPSRRLEHALQRPRHS